MYKIVTLLSLSFHLLFSATSNQVDEYMSLVHADRSLIELEQMFENISESVETSDENVSEELTLSYQIYLGKHLSEDELDALLAIYRKPIMKQYTNEMDMIEIPEEEMKAFLNALEESPLSTERQDIIDELVATLINEELMLNFYQSMVQRYKKSSSKENNNSKDTNKTSKKTPTEEEKKFIEIMKKGTKQELLYGTQVLSTEELKAVNEIMNSSIISKATKVESEALIEIMNTFINRIVSEPKKLEKK